jgi:hypothetical protein
VRAASFRLAGVDVGLPDERDVIVDPGKVEPALADL